MIGETNINGGAGLNGKEALLKIKSQTGSIITVSKGSYSKIIKVSQLDPDNDRWSYWFFQTTDFGEWTVTATNGAYNATTNVSITAEGQSESVTLFCGYWIFDNGVIHPDVGSFQGLAGVTLTGGKIVATYSSSVDNTFQFSTAVDLLSKGTVMHIKMISTKGNASYPTCIGAFSPQITNSAYNTNKAKKQATTQIANTTQLPETVYDIDLTGLTAGTSYWIGGIAYGTFEISQIWIAED